MSTHDDDPLMLLRWASMLQPLRPAAELEASEVGDLVPPNGDVVRRAGDLSPAVGDLVSGDGYWSPSSVEARRHIGLNDLVSPLEASQGGHRAYPAGACSPTHKDGCLRCAELELDTAEERYRRAWMKVSTLKGKVSTDPPPQLVRP